MPPPRKIPRLESNQFSPGLRNEQAKPMRIPGKLIMSGMVWWRRSMTMITSRAAVKGKKIKKGDGKEKTTYKAQDKRPIINSISGYCQDIVFLQ